MTDVVLSNGVAVGAALPEIVELVIDPGSRTAGAWRLCRPSGDRLDEDMTLGDNGIRDGDVLVLSASPAPVFVRAAGDVGTVSTAAAPPGLPGGAAAWAWCAAMAAATVLGSVMYGGAAMTAPVIAAAVAVAGAAAAWRAPAVPAATAGGVLAVVFSTAAGYLAVGTASPAPAALLAAAAGAASAVVLARMTAADTVLLTAVGTYATLLTVALAPAALGVGGPAVSASMLCVAAVGVLGGTARLVIILTGLTPTLPGPDGTRITGRRARYARRVLTGLVTGGAAAAASGCVLLAAVFTGGAAQPVLAVVVTGAVLLRCRTYADGGCRTALVIGGLSSATATSALLLRWIPVQAGWVTAVAVAVVAIMYTRRTAFSPAVARAVDAVEVAVLAAVIPAAGWCAGLFGAVRDLSLPW